MHQRVGVPSASGVHGSSRGARIIARSRLHVNKELVISERPGPLALSSPSSERGTRRLHDCASRPRQLGSQWPESGSLPGSPGRPAYLRVSLLVQWHLDRGQLPVMVRPCSRGISVHTPVNLSAGVTQAPGTALSGKGPCVGLLKPKVKRRHWWFQNADALNL